MERVDPIIAFAKAYQDLGLGLVIGLLVFLCAGIIRKLHQNMYSGKHLWGTLSIVSLLLISVIGLDIYFGKNRLNEDIASPQYLIRGKLAINKTTAELMASDGKLYTSLTASFNPTQNYVEFVYEAEDAKTIPPGHVIPLHFYPEGKKKFQESFSANGAPSSPFSPPIYQLKFKDEYYANKIILRQENEGISVKDGASYSRLKLEKIDLGEDPSEFELSRQSNLKTGETYTVPSLISSAFAATENIEEKTKFVIQQFRSGDPILARKTVEFLVSEGNSGIQIIEVSLIDSDQTVAQLVYTLLALNQFLPEYSAKISDEAKTRVFAASADEHRGVRELAIQYIRSHASKETLDRLMQLSKYSKPDDWRTPYESGLAIAMFETAYVLGIRQKERIWVDQIGKSEEEKKVIARVNFDKAEIYFNFAWGLRDQVDTSDELVSPKALWGWGLAANTLAKKVEAERSFGVQLAKQKFNMLLAKAEFSQTYRYPDHILKATYFMQNGKFEEGISSNKPQIVYYQKLADRGIIVKTLEENGLELNVRTSTRNKHKTNAIWFGRGVEIDKVRDVGRLLLKAGVELKSMKPFSVPDKKLNWIEIGTYADYDANSTITVQEVQTLTNKGLPVRVN